MRWPSFSDPFRQCCGLRERPRAKNYDAWLARERLAQLKRLEGRLADLTQENAKLAEQLGQAVNVMDSYHNFDMAALQGASSVGDDRSDQSRSNSRGNSLARPSANSAMRRAPDMRSQPSRSRAESLAARDPSIGGPRIRSAIGSLPTQQFAPSAAPQVAIPERLLRLGVPPNGATPVATPQPPPQVGTVSLADIPSAQELNDLLNRNAPGRRPRRLSTAPATSALSRASSAALPPVSSLSHLINAAPAQANKGVQESNARASLDTQPDNSSNSFTFSPSGRLQTSLPPVHEEEPETPAASRPGIMVERSQPATHAAPVPVQDKAMLATQARGQIYSSHYSAATSPFAQAAARMPRPDGSSPLRDRPSAARR